MEVRFDISQLEELESGECPAATPARQPAAQPSYDGERSNEPPEAVRVAGGLVVHFIVGEDEGVDGAFCVSATRMSGTTVDFHYAFRQVKRCINLTEADCRPLIGADDGVGDACYPPRAAHLGCAEIATRAAEERLESSLQRAA